MAELGNSLSASICCCCKRKPRKARDVPPDEENPLQVEKRRKGALARRSEDFDSGSEELLSKPMSKRDTVELDSNESCNILKSDASQEGQTASLNMRMEDYEYSGELLNSEASDEDPVYIWANKRLRLQNLNEIIGYLNMTRLVFPKFFEAY